ncbi:Hsp70 family protein [Actinosynnema sp. NPDC047251]|uniref:caspase, EACC1-associated type n=1 Tax=Saccharothrix espanaensis TaxID=103731 RepID=UPI0022B24B5C|nr:Hsp70 family protein [Saccharothrix espanaensis]
MIVANQVYDDERFTDLPGAAADARDLADVLGSYTVGEFDVRVVAEESARTVRREVERFFAAAARDDLLLLHFSCHGKRNEANRELHFVAKDTESDYLASTGVSAHFVNERIEQSRCRRVVLMLDCCFSGSYVKGMRSRAAKAAARVEVDQHFEGQGKAVITACAALQYAHESTLRSVAPGQPSVFTSTVVEGLRTGAADVDSDGHISVEDLYRYVHHEVRRKVPDQTPELSVDRLSGSFYIGRNIRSLHLGSQHAPMIPVPLHRAVVSAEPWERYGAALGLERLLDDASPRIRDAAREALIPLTRDADDEVATRAKAVWASRIGSRVPLPVTGPGGDREVAPAGRHAVGIDFGTTNSAVAVVGEDGPRVIVNGQESVLTPSVVGFPERGGVDVGIVAGLWAAARPDRTVFAVKRKLGTDWVTTVDGWPYTAENVAAYILDRLRLDAEQQFGTAVDAAVITVPAYYGVAEREALVHAAGMAGLHAQRLINEPTAAALAYGVTTDGERRTVLVVDLGGGTLDVSVLDLAAGSVEVRAASGDNDLGGDDWDGRVADWLLTRFARTCGVAVDDDPRVGQLVRDAAVAAKIALSDQDSTTVNLRYLSSAGGVPRHLVETLTRDEFEELTADLLDRCRSRIEQVLTMAGADTADLHEVVLVGGATRMPAVAALVRRLTGRDPATGVDPDQAIALGAALQAGVLSGDVPEVVLLEVTPLALGVEADGGVVTLIGENTTIPAKRSELFTTTRANQPVAQVRLHQFAPHPTGDDLTSNDLTSNDLAGNDPAGNDTTIAELRLQLHTGPRGEASIEVTVDCDVNGVVHLQVRQLGTKRSVATTVSRSTVLDAAQRSKRPHSAIALRVERPVPRKRRRPRTPRKPAPVPVAPPGTALDVPGTDLALASARAELSANGSRPGHVAELRRNGAALREAGRVEEGLRVGRLAVATASAYVRADPDFPPALLIGSLVELSTTQLHAGLLGEAHKACGMALLVAHEAGPASLGPDIERLPPLLIVMGEAMYARNRRQEATVLVVNALSVLVELSPAEPRRHLAAVVEALALLRHLGVTDLDDVEAALSTWPKLSALKAPDVWTP